MKVNSQRKGGRARGEGPGEERGEELNYRLRNCSDTEEEGNLVG